MVHKPVSVEKALPVILWQKKWNPSRTMKYNGEKANGYLKPNYSYFLLQGIFSTQGSYPSLLHCKCIIYPLGSPRGTMKVKVKLLSCVWLFATPWTVACQAPLSMVFSRQEYWSGLLCPPPEDLPDSGIELESPASPAWQADSLSQSHWTTWSYSLCEWPSPGFLKV